MYLHLIFLLITYTPLCTYRVPGNFHFHAESKHHTLNPKIANLSHVVNELSFGYPLTDRMTRRLSTLNKQYFDKSTLEPMNGNVYATKELHQAYHHYFKVVSTQIEAGRI